MGIIFYSKDEGCKLQDLDNKTYMLKTKIWSNFFGGEIHASDYFCSQVDDRQ